MATGSIANMSTIATQAAFSAWTVMNAFLIVLVLFGMLVLFARYAGRGSFAALLLSLYAAYAPYVLFPYLSLLPASSSEIVFFSHAGLYAVFVFIFYLIMRRMINPDFFSIGTFGFVLLALLGAGFLVAFAAHVLSVSAFYHFTPAIASLFIPDQYFFWWFAAPAIGLFFFIK